MKKIKLISMVKILKVAAVSLFVLSNMCCEGMSFTEFAKSPENKKSIVAQVIVNRQSIQYEVFDLIIAQLNKQWTCKDIRENMDALLKLSSENVDTIGVQEGYVMSKEAKELMEAYWTRLRICVQNFKNSCGGLDGVPDSMLLSRPLNFKFSMTMAIGVSIASMLAKLEANEENGIWEMRQALAMEHNPAHRARAANIIINNLADL
jgi:hypothetical protein